MHSVGEYDRYRLETWRVTPLLTVTVVIGMIGIGLLTAGFVIAFQNNALKSALDLQLKNLQVKDLSSSPMQMRSLFQAVEKTKNLAKVLYLSGCLTASVSLLVGVMIHTDRGRCNKVKWVALGALALLAVGIGMMVGYGLWRSCKLPKVLDQSVYQTALKAQQTLYVTALNFMVVGMVGSTISLLYIAKQTLPKRVPN